MAENYFKVRLNSPNCFVSSVFVITVVVCHCYDASGVGICTY